MIRAIGIKNHLGQYLRIDLFNPYETGFVVESVDGLGPVKADINFTELATNDGAIDNSAKLSTRNIVINLSFLEKDTIEETRLKSYKYFPIKKKVTFYVETDSRKAEAYGRIEENKPNIFSKKEGTQISILCDDPYFYLSGEDQSDKFYGVIPEFEFPFSNESLTEKLICFGDIQTKTEAVIYYEGDADVGFVMKIHATGSAKGITIYNMKTREIMKINDDKLIEIVENGISAGDDIIINSRRGEKGIQLVRGGRITNILNALDRPINWFRLEKGDNLFTYTADEGLDHLFFEIDYKLTYEGV